MSDRLPPHDPPPDAGLIQPEANNRDDTIVVRGDDRDHVLPPTELDPYTPDTSTTGKQRTAIWLEIAVVVVAVAAMIVAIVLG
jgi:hypothetical protein